MLKYMLGVRLKGGVRGGGGYNLMRVNTITSTSLSSNSNSGGVSTRGNRNGLLTERKFIRKARELMKRTQLKLCDDGIDPVEVEGWDRKLSKLWELNRVPDEGGHLHSRYTGPRDLARYLVETKSVAGTKLLVSGVLGGEGGKLLLSDRVGAWWFWKCTEYFYLEYHPVKEVAEKFIMGEEEGFKWQRELHRIFVEVVYDLEGSEGLVGWVRQCSSFLPKKSFTSHWEREVLAELGVLSINLVDNWSFFELVTTFPPPLNFHSNPESLLISSWVTRHREVMRNSYLHWKLDTNYFRLLLNHLTYHKVPPVNFIEVLEDMRRLKVNFTVGMLDSVYFLVNKLLLIPPTAGSSAGGGGDNNISTEDLLNKLHQLVLHLPSKVNLEEFQLTLLILKTQDSLRRSQLLDRLLNLYPHRPNLTMVWSSLNFFHCQSQYQLGLEWYEKFSPLLTGTSTRTSDWVNYLYDRVDNVGLCCACQAHQPIQANAIYSRLKSRGGELDSYTASVFLNLQTQLTTSATTFTLGYSLLPTLFTQSPHVHSHFLNSLFKSLLTSHRVPLLWSLLKGYNSRRLIFTTQTFSILIGASLLERDLPRALEFLDETLRRSPPCDLPLVTLFNQLIDYCLYLPPHYPTGHQLLRQVTHLHLPTDSQFTLLSLKALTLAHPPPTPATLLAYLTDLPDKSHLNHRVYHYLLNHFLTPTTPTTAPRLDAACRTLQLMRSQGFLPRRQLYTHHLLPRLHSHPSLHHQIQSYYERDYPNSPSPSLPSLRGTLLYDPPSPCHPITPLPPSLSSLNL